MKKPFQRTATDELPETPIEVDSYGIPILDEVVEFDPIGLDDSAFTGEAAPAPPSHALNLPEHDALLKAIREQLKSQLQDELELMVDQVMAETIPQVTMEMEKAMQKKFHGSLKSRIGELIELALNQHLGDEQDNVPDALNADSSND